MAISEYIVIFMIVGIFVFFFYLLIIKGKKSKLDFKEVLFGEEVYKKISEKVDLNGKKVKKGELIFGYNIVQNISRYFEFSGVEHIFEYDETKNIYLKNEKDDKITYNMLIFEVKSKNIFLKLFNIRNEYYLINKDEIKDIRFDHTNNRWFLPNYLDFVSYGNVWICDDVSKEYLRKIGLAFYDESLQTHLMNNPDRVVALNTDHAMKVNIIKESNLSESRKYEDAKKTSDTVVT